MDHDAEAGQSHGSTLPMASPMAMMAREHYGQYRWVQAVIAGLALWLITSPFALGYTSAAMTWSDVISGIVALVLAGLALGRTRGLASWANAAVGIWLMLAPLVFWAPDPVAYANDTLVGALLVAFGLVIPMGMEMKGQAIPDGWSYNPSSWPQRVPVIALGFGGFLIARYMTGYQLGYLPDAWDPFFGDGTRKVLDSDISKMWPVSDAGLGAAMYLIEVLSSFMGDRRRWRTMPWMVAIFGLAVVPLGVASIVLIILQPLAVGAWCSLCLFTAFLMLLMIPLSLDEVVAMIQFLIRRKREGASVWRTFWLGDHLPEVPGEEKNPKASEWTLGGMIGGLAGSVPLYLTGALGIWLMFAPAVFGSEGAMADSEHLVGALVVVVAGIALAEVGRPVRFLNVACGGWLAVAPWLLEGGSAAANWTSAAAGVAIVLLSFPMGRIRESYGTFDRFVIWSPFATVGSRRQRRVRAA